jgi:OTU domain-containing protein 6
LVATSQLLSANSEEVKSKELELAIAKRTKANKKKDKKEEKEKHRQDMKIEIKKSSTGLNQREIECNAIEQQLVTEALCIKPIISDGHCLYRSIADQLSLYSEGSCRMDYKALRVLTAQHLRTRSIDYAPFLGCLPDSPEFFLYCDKIENEALAEWGGQVEIQALCEALQRRVFVYSAGAPLLQMGSDNIPGDAASPLRVSYHKHYYALGEHYNSVVPAP